MARVVIVGGHGKIALQLAQLLTERGDEVVSTIRNPDHEADVAAVGATAAHLDLEAADSDAYAAVFAGADAVVFSAGAGADGRIDRKRTVDLGGSTKSVDGALAAGVRRFVQVSAISVDEPLPDDVSDVWRAYVEAKRDADAYLRQSDLDWTVVRPGGLTDEPGTGQVGLGASVERGDIPRADVAAVVAACLADDSTIGAQFEVVGGTVPVAAAVRGTGR